MIIAPDFDGTLHPINRRNGFLSCLPLFEDCVRQFDDAELLITSAYRIDHSLVQVKACFSEDIAARIIGVTPNRYIEVGNETWQRQREIEQALRQLGREHDDWVALDDADWLFEPNCPHLILVDPANGFGRRDRVRLEQALRRNTVHQT